MMDGEPRTSSDIRDALRAIDPIYYRNATTNQIAYSIVKIRKRYRCPIITIGKKMSRETTALTQVYRYIPQESGNDGKTHE